MKYLTDLPFKSIYEKILIICWSQSEPIQRIQADMLITALNISPKTIKFIQVFQNLTKYFKKLFK